MPTINVERSLEINTTKERAWKYVSDFDMFGKYDPFTIIEPTTKMEQSQPTTGLGAWHKWDGKIVGAGKMELVSQAEDKSYVEFTLDFVRPKSTGNSAYWKLEESQRDGQTYCTVTWGMNARFPWFMVPMLPFFRKMFENSIANSYDLGLKLLRKELDKDAPDIRISYEGAEEREPCHYVGIPFSQKSSEEIAEQFDNFLPALKDYLAKQAIKMKDTDILGIYKNYKMKTNTMDGVVACILPESTVNALADSEFPEGYVKGTIDNGLYMKVRYQGLDNDLGHGWGVLMMGAMSLQNKRQRKMPTFEITVKRFDDEPGKEDQHITDLYAVVDRTKFEDFQKS